MTDKKENAFTPLNEVQAASGIKLVVTKDSRGRLLLIEEQGDGYRLGCWRIEEALRALRYVEEERRSQGEDFGRAENMFERLKRAEGKVAEVERATRIWTDAIEEKVNKLEKIVKPRRWFR